MYNYHNHARKKINGGELIGYTEVENYKNDGWRLILHFSSPPLQMPIRKGREDAYINDILNVPKLDRRK